MQKTETIKLQSHQTWIRILLYFLLTGSSLCLKQGHSYDLRHMTVVGTNCDQMCCHKGKGLAQDLTYPRGLMNRQGPGCQSDRQVVVLAQVPWAEGPRCNRSPARSWRKLAWFWACMGQAWQRRCPLERPLWDLWPGTVHTPHEATLWSAELEIQSLNNPPARKRVCPRWVGGGGSWQRWRRGRAQKPPWRSWWINENGIQKSKFLSKTTQKTWSEMAMFCFVSCSTEKLIRSLLLPNRKQEADLRKRGSLLGDWKVCKWGVERD